MNIEKLKELREFMANLDESRVELNHFFSSEDSDHKKTYNYRDRQCVWSRVPEYR
jgi:hypothetical protein